MTELTVDFPVKLNGIIITEGVWKNIGAYQTNGIAYGIEFEYNNAGVAIALESYQNLNNYLIEKIALADIDEDIATEKSLISDIHYLKSDIKHFAVPDKLINELNKAD